MIKQRITRPPTCYDRKSFWRISCRNLLKDWTLFFRFHIWYEYDKTVAGSAESYERKLLSSKVVLLPAIIAPRSFPILPECLTSTLNPTIHLTLTLNLTLNTIVTLTLTISIITSTKLSQEQVSGHLLEVHATLSCNRQVTPRIHEDVLYIALAVSRQRGVCSSHPRQDLMLTFILTEHRETDEFGNQNLQ